ncbi:MAG: hypothetical protein ABSD88_06825 [Candidatus Korobacteraceae bacterium]
MLALLLATACNRGKKPSLPPQATAPTISVPPTTRIGQQPAPPPQTTAPPATDAQTGVIPRPSGKTTTQPKPRIRIPGRRDNASKSVPPPPAPPAPAQPAPQKPGETGQLLIGAQVPQGTAQNTEQLLQAAESNLRRVTRALSDGEQAMIQQVRNYISQSRTAAHDGDLERAYNLANKANLLSVELAK